MDGGGRENSEGTENLGTDGEDTGTGGQLPTGLGDVLQGGGAGGCAGGSSIWVKDVGAYPPHRKGPGKFSSQRHQADYREADKSMVVWDLVVLTSADRYGRIRV